MFLLSLLFMEGLPELAWTDIRLGFHIEVLNKGALGLLIDFIPHSIAASGAAYST